MNYTKPQLAVLGQAVRVIEGSTTVKGAYTPHDAGLQVGLMPAYDLDE